MEVHNFENIYNYKILGKAWAESLNGYITSFIDEEWDPTDSKTVLEMSMFGDPTLAIEDGKDPKSISIQKPNISNNFVAKLLKLFPRMDTLLKNIEQYF